MKRNAIVRIILYTFLALTLTAVMICGILEEGFTFGIHINTGGTTVEDKVTLDASRIQNIDINWAAGSVEIRTADSDQISIEEIRSENAKAKMTYKISGNTLQLDYGEAKVSIGFGCNSMESKNLIVTVPKDWACEELEIDGAYLDIDIQILNVQKIDLDGASCSLNFSGSLDRIDIDGASAKITLNCTNRISAINVDGASCDLDVTLPKDCGFRLEMDGLNCDLHTELPGIAADGKTVYGDGHCQISVDGISCDVTIHESK